MAFPWSVSPKVNTGSTFAGAAVIDDVGVSKGLTATPAFCADAVDVTINADTANENK